MSQSSESSESSYYSNDVCDICGDDIAVICPLLPCQTRKRNLTGINLPSWVDIGSARSSPINGRSATTRASGSKDSKNDAPQRETCIGRSLPPSPDLSVYEQSKGQLQTDIGSSPGRKRPKNTFGKRTPASTEPNLKKDDGLSKETPKPTGKKCFAALREENLRMYPLTSLYGTKKLMVAIIDSSPVSLQILQKQLESRKRLTYFMDEPALEKVDVHGMKPAWVLTLKIHAQNGGMDTEVKKMLSLMNFEVTLTFPTFYGGSTVTRSVWSAKDLAYPYEHGQFGLLQTWLLANGIQPWTTKLD